MRDRPVFICLHIIVPYKNRSPDFLLFSITFDWRERRGEEIKILLSFSRGSSSYTHL